MRELLPAWPPTANASTPSVVSPSDAPYTAAAKPGGTAADDDEVEATVGKVGDGDAEVLRELAHGRAGATPSPWR